MHLPGTDRSGILVANDVANLVDDNDPSRLVIDDANVHFTTSRDAVQAVALSMAVQSLVDDAKASSFNRTLAVITAPISFRYSFTGYSHIAVYGALIPLSASSPPAVIAWANYSIDGTPVAVQIPPSAAVVTNYPLFTSAVLDPDEQHTLAAEIWASPDSPYLVDYLLAFSPKPPAYQRNNGPAPSSQDTNSSSITTSNSTSSTSDSISTASSSLTSISTSTPAPAPTSSTHPFPPWAIAALIIIFSVTVAGLVWLVYHNKRRSERFLERWSPYIQERDLVSTGTTRPHPGPAAGRRYIDYPSTRAAPHQAPLGYMIAAAYPARISTHAGIFDGVSWLPLQYYPGSAFAPWRST